MKDTQRECYTYYPVILVQILFLARLHCGCQLTIKQKSSVRVLVQLSSVLVCTLDKVANCDQSTEHCFLISLHVGKMGILGIMFLLCLSNQHICQVVAFPLRWPFNTYMQKLVTCLNSAKSGFLLFYSKLEKKCNDTKILLLSYINGSSPTKVSVG